MNYGLKKIGYLYVQYRYLKMLKGNDYKGLKDL